MSKDNDISATEKLLEMIRGEGAADQENTSGLELDSPSMSGLSLESSSSPDEVAQDNTTAPALDTNEAHPDPQNLNLESEPPPTKTADKTTISLEKRAGRPVNFFLRTKETIAKNLSLVSKKITSLGRTTAIKVGIDLQEHSLSIAVLPAGPIILRKENFLSVTIPPLEDETTRWEDPEFIQFFKKQIDKVCKNSPKAEIWCSPNSADAEILTIIIPKVPKKEIANAVFWSTKKETEYDLNKYVFDFSIRQEITEGNLKKIIITVYLLPIQRLNGLKNLFRKAGIHLTGVTLPSSAFENIARNGFLPDIQDTSVHLSFAHDLALIDMYHKGAMLFTRKIKTGISSIVESIFDKAAEQDLFLDDQSAIKLLFSNTKLSFYQSDQTDDQELKELADLLTPDDLPVTTRLSRQLSRTFDYCSTHFKIPRASCLLTSGPFILKKPILNQLEADLNISCNIIDLCPNDNNILPALTPDIPDEINPIPAFGLAMSEKDSTQNFLYTFADKKEFIKETRINQGIALVTIVLALLCGAFFILQHQTVKEKREIVEQLTAKLEAQYLQDARSRDATFSQMASKKIAGVLDKNNKTAQRFQAMATIGLLLENIPAEIKLTDLLMAPTTAQKTKKAKGTQKTTSKDVNSIRMQGVISGHPERQNFILLDFQKSLYNLPIINEAAIDQKESTISEDGDHLYFTINMRTNRDIF